MSKNANKTRTSLWLDDKLRAIIDVRAKRDQRSLGFTIDALLRKGLGLASKPDPKAAPKPATQEERPSAPIFG